MTQLNNILIRVCVVNKNKSKTELLVAASNHNLKILSDVSLILDDTTIFPSSVIRNLGVMLESDMSMTSHVASISSSTNYHLRNIARIRRFMDKDTWKQAVRALITLCLLSSRLKTSKNFKRYKTGLRALFSLPIGGTILLRWSRTPLATSQRTDFI